MAKHSHVGLIVLAMAATAALSAQAPLFTGTWKLNVVKSQLTGETMTFEKKASGVMHWDSQGFGYDFDLAGNEYPIPTGGRTSWRVITETTWEVTNRINGATAIYRLTLSGANTLNRVATFTNSNGKSPEEKARFSRVSGGPGFFGKWKSTKMVPVPLIMKIGLEGNDGIVVAFPDAQVVNRGKFDGKDYPVVLSGGNLKETVSFERLGPGSFKSMQKVDGKPGYARVFTVSADGKTLTIKGNAVSVNEPTTEVYDRQ